MDTHLAIGESYNLELRHAMLVYGDQHRAFATLHEVARQQEGAPVLGPARPLSLAFLRELARGLGSQIAPEILPTTVLVRTSEMIVWWSPAARRPMFFGAADEEVRKLNGGVFPHPPLVFKVRRGELSVRALERNVRPESTTRLMTAPYWNIGADAKVCLGLSRGTGQPELLRMLLSHQSQRGRTVFTLVNSRMLWAPYGSLPATAAS